MDLQELFLSMEKYLRSVGYAEATIIRHKYSWNQYSRYCKSKEFDHFDFSEAAKFVKEHYHVDFYEDKSCHSEQECHIFRVFKSLDEFQAGVPITSHRKRQKVEIPTAFSVAIQAYLIEFGKTVKKASIDDANYTLRKFAEYLVKQKICDLNQINITHIIGFRETLKDYVATTRNAWMAKIKDFFEYAYTNNITSQCLANLIVKPRYTPSAKLPSLYSEQEIELLLSKVDQGSPVGKRDYAILLLAARLGMRSGDISNLMFENILWDKDAISFTQEKTGQAQILPLLNDVGDAIVNYLREGRPKSEEQHIFLKANAPYSKLSSAAMHPIMEKYAKLAKLKNDLPRKYGLHAFRHSLSSNLLKKKTPLPVISEILGHLKTETTSVYARVDTNNLKQCALDVPFALNFRGDDDEKNNV